MVDAFGLALIGYLEGGTKFHEIERDDGRVEKIDTGWYFRPFEEWPEAEQELAGYSIGKVLEVGCGGGRISKYLESQGHEVIGIDLSSYALQAAMIHGASDCRLIDARDIDFPDDYFDTVSLLGNGLGILGNVDEGRTLLMNLSRMIRKDGLLIASSRDPAKTDDEMHIAYHQMNRDRGKPIGLVRLRINYEDKKGDWFDLLFVESKEVENFIKGTGWTVEKMLTSDEPLESLYGVVLKNNE
jgi:SAM-dependent methyltransferase